MSNSTLSHPPQVRRRGKIAAPRTGSRPTDLRHAQSYQDTFNLKENSVVLQAFPYRPSAYIQQSQFKTSYNKLRLSPEGHNSWLDSSSDGSYVASERGRRVFSAPVSYSYPGNPVRISGRGSSEFQGHDWLTEYKKTRSTTAMGLSRGDSQMTLYNLNKVDHDIMEFVKNNKTPYNMGLQFKDGMSNPLMVRGHGADASDGPTARCPVQAWDSNPDSSRRGSDCPSPLGSKLSAATPTPVASDSEDEGINSMAEEEGPSTEIIFSGNDGMPHVINKETGPLKTDDTDYEHAASHMLRYYMRLENLQKGEQGRHTHCHNQNGGQSYGSHQTSLLRASLPGDLEDGATVRKFELPSARTPRRLGGGRMSHGRSVYSTLYQKPPENTPTNHKPKPSQCILNPSFIQIHKPLPQPRPIRKNHKQAVKRDPDKSDAMSVMSQQSAVTNQSNNSSTIRITAHVPVITGTGKRTGVKGKVLQNTSLTNV